MVWSLNRPTVQPKLLQLLHGRLNVVRPRRVRGCKQALVVSKSGSIRSLSARMFISGATPCGPLQTSTRTPLEHAMLQLSTWVMHIVAFGISIYHHRLCSSADDEILAISDQLTPSNTIHRTNYLSQTTALLQHVDDMSCDASQLQVPTTCLPRT
jgi:hypothetical protein